MTRRVREPLNQTGLTMKVTRIRYRHAINAQFEKFHQFESELEMEVEVEEGQDPAAVRAELKRQIHNDLDRIYAERVDQLRTIKREVR